jgi:predicted membrane-bound dolichyl-phosphate-mannose-protein mannosyltransferase
MDDSVILDLGSTFPLQKINMYTGVGGGKFKMEASTDSKQWTPLNVTEAQYTSVFTWNTLTEIPDSRFIKVTSDSSNIRLHELGVFVKGEEKPAQIHSILPGVTGGALQGHAERLVDEQDLVPFTPSFMNSMYFDEIYHGRTAYEHIHLIEPYETTHPPLGKDLIALGVLVFGMDPFGWRVIGTIFGVMMIPLMYIFAFRLFQRTVYATWAALLMAFDFMHFVQTRISTVDVYLVFFVMLTFYYMYRYSRIDAYKKGLAQSLLPLFLSGLFFGMAAATKWSAMYGGVGLAAIFAYCLAVRHLQYRRAVRIIAAGSSDIDASSEVENDSAASAERIVKQYPLYTIKTIVYTGLFFTVIPILVYVLSYIPFLMVPGPGHGLQDVVKFQKFMYDYHSKLVATHSFASPWWQWPVMVKPVWYYSGPQLPAGKVASIVALGNPLIWWAGIAAFGYTIYSMFRKKSAWIMLVPVVAYVSLYLPWTLVPRLTFLYHYFPMVPFLILFLVYSLKTISERFKYGREVSTAYLIVAGVLFALFYPVMSGLIVDKNFVNFGLRWFQSWIF